MESLEISCTSPNCVPLVSNVHQSSPFAPNTRPTSIDRPSTSFLYITASESPRRHVTPSSDVAIAIESSPRAFVAAYHIVHRVASSPRNAFTTGAPTCAPSNASRCLSSPSRAGANTRPASSPPPRARVVRRDVAATSRARRVVRVARATVVVAVARDMSVARRTAIVDRRARRARVAMRRRRARRRRDRVGRDVAFRANLLGIRWCSYTYVYVCVCFTY